MYNSTIIHVPHASTVIPKEFLNSFDLSKINHEIDVMTDWFCDELFDCGREIHAPKVSRLVCDTERFRADEDEIMSSVGMGAVYTSCSDLSKLRSVSDNEKELILRKYYDTHHREFTETVERKLDIFGRCLIIDGHSFYPSPLAYELNQDIDRPDFCIGISDFHTPLNITVKLKEKLEKHGFYVKINEPFSGTIVPLKFYEKEKRVTSVMIEINRKLYMDSPGFKSKNFDLIKQLISECVELIEKCNIPDFD